MREYNPIDIFKTILIAESWVPNINHFIKFSLLFEIFFTISKEDFIGKRIKNYNDFSFFLNRVFKILPHNPIIEDFYPVGDWGEVKFQLGENHISFFMVHRYLTIMAFLKVLRLDTQVTHKLWRILNKSLKYKIV